MKIVIKHRWNADKILYDGEHANMREAVQAAIAARANLTGANLTGADLTRAKEDLRTILAIAPNEVQGLLDKLRAGEIDGSVYEGECACLVGTIANLRHCDYTDIPNILPDSSRPAERLFLAIYPGNTPENHPVAKLVAEWIEEWQAEQMADSVEVGKQTHTPGPWLMETVATSAGVCHKIGPFVGRLERPNYACVYADGERLGAKPSLIGEQLAANARLIAAAPDLLKAAKGVVEAQMDFAKTAGREAFFPDHACAECRPNSDIVIPGFRCANHALRAAIAKAEGQ